MKFSKMMKHLHLMKFDVVRHLATGNLEAVLPRGNLRDVLPILGAHFGAPLKSPESSPSSEMIAIAAPLGGIRDGQTLYYSENHGKAEVAALWPWKDGDHVTLKVLAGSAPQRMDSPLIGKEPFMVERSKLREAAIEVLVVGTQESLEMNIRDVLKAGGFNVQSESTEPSLECLFQRGSYVPRAVLLNLSRRGWPGLEVLSHIKVNWPRTKILIYADEDVPWQVSLRAIRHADLFQRGQEDWLGLGDVIKKALSGAAHGMAGSRDLVL